MSGLLLRRWPKLGKMVCGGKPLSKFTAQHSVSICHISNCFVFFISGISFTPHETGTHLVNVYKDGQHIANSPFKINVTRNEVGNADKVKVYGDGLTHGMANEVNEFYVDTKDAGKI